MAPSSSNKDNAPTQLSPFTTLLVVIVILIVIVLFVFVTIMRYWLASKALTTGNPWVAGAALAPEIGGGIGMVFQ